MHPWPTPCRQEPGGLWVESHTNSDRSDQDRLVLLSFRIKSVFFNPGP